MKAALINSSNIVQNVIVWENTYVCPEGLTAIVVNDDVSVASNFIYNQDGTFTDPNPPPVEPPVTPPTISELQAQLNAIQSQIQALSGGQ